MMRRTKIRWGAVLPSFTAVFLLTGPRLLAAQTECAERIARQIAQERARKNTVPSGKGVPEEKETPPAIGASFSAQVLKPADSDAAPDALPTAGRTAFQANDGLFLVIEDMQLSSRCPQHCPPYRAHAPPVSSFIS